MICCCSKDALHMGEGTVFGDLHFSQAIICQRTLTSIFLSSTYWAETVCVLSES